METKSREIVSRIAFPEHCQSSIQLTIDADAPLTAELIASVDDACDECEDNGPSSLLIIHLVGQLDSPRRAWPGDADLRLVGKWERALHRVERLDAITLALVEHMCGGAGLEILLTTDFRILTPGTRIRIPADTSGVWPGLWVYRVVNQIGFAKSRKLVLNGGELVASEVIALGLADDISTNLASSANCFLASLGSTSVRNRGILRRLLLEGLALSYEQALGNHLAACDLSLRFAGK